jgi:hypothetical protein
MCPGAYEPQQSRSFAAVQPVGQQASRAFEQAVIGMWRQAVLQVAGSPTNRSLVHGSPSSAHEVGQVLGGSQVSPEPMRPSPQRGSQSLSLTAEQPCGQQPSSFMQPVIAWWMQVRVQASAEPDVKSSVQAIPSSHDFRQAPGVPAVIARSQLSRSSTTPSPQIAGQSESTTAEQPAGQQLSPPTQALIGVAMQVALQAEPLPCTA